MSQIQEVKFLFWRRIEQLQQRKKQCIDRHCINKIDDQIERTKELSNIIDARRRSFESKSLNFTSKLISEVRPNSAAAKVATYGLGALATYKAAKWAIMKDRCKEYKYSPYLHKRCMKGLDEEENIMDGNQLRQILREEESKLREAEGWHGKPRGWKQSSIKKFSKSLTGKKATQKGFFDKCVSRMKGKVSNPEAYCAATKDEVSGSTFWRGKGKSPQQAGKDVKRIRNVRRG